MDIYKQIQNQLIGAAQKTSSQAASQIASNLSNIDFGIFRANPQACDQCLKLDGSRVPLGVKVEDISHKNCRCWIDWPSGLQINQSPVISGSSFIRFSIGVEGPGIMDFEQGTEKSAPQPPVLPVVLQLSGLLMKALQ